MLRAVTTARVLGGVAAGFAVAGAVLVVVTLVLTFAFTPPGTGADIGAGFVLLAGVGLLVLAAVVALTGLVARAVRRAP